MIIIVLCAVIVIAGAGYFLYDRLLRPTEETIKIGASWPLTGSLAHLGAMGKAAQLAAVQKINSEGGILGRNVSIIFADDEANPTKATTTAKKLITEDNCDFILGTETSACALATAEVCADYKKVYMVSIPATEQFTGLVTSNYNRYKYLFRCGWNSTIAAVWWTQSCLDFCETVIGQTPKSLLFLMSDLLGPRACGDEVLRIFGNVTNVDVWYLTPGKEDFSAEIERIKEANPDVLLPQLGVATDIAFAHQWKAAGQPIFTIWCTGIAGQRMTLKELGPDYSEYVTVWQTTWRVPITSKTIETFDRITAEYAKEGMGQYFDKAVGDMLEFCTYDSLLVLADAITRAGTLDSDAVVTALEQTNNFEGALGHYFFYSNHQSPITPTVIGQWRNDEVHVVFPAVYKEIEWVRPPWLATNVFPLP
jgi:branched-chain amino acid transport system substrate-binding protein